MNTHPSAAIELLNWANAGTWTDADDVELEGAPLGSIRDPQTGSLAITKVADALTYVVGQGLAEITLIRRDTTGRRMAIHVVDASSEDVRAVYARLQLVGSLDDAIVSVTAAGRAATAASRLCAEYDVAPAAVQTRQDRNLAACRAYLDEHKPDIQAKWRDALEHVARSTSPLMRVEIADAIHVKHETFKGWMQRLKAMGLTRAQHHGRRQPGFIWQTPDVVVPPIIHP